MPFPAATGPYPPLAFLSLVSRHNERDICILDGADLAPVSPGSDRWIEVSPCFLATVMIPFGERSSLRASISRCLEGWYEQNFVYGISEISFNLPCYINYRISTNCSTNHSDFSSFLYIPFINSKGKKEERKKKEQKILRNTVTTENSHGYQYLNGRVKKTLYHVGTSEITRF